MQVRGYSEPGFVEAVDWASGPVGVFDWAGFSRRFGRRHRGVVSARSPSPSVGDVGEPFGGLSAGH